MVVGKLEPGGYIKPSLRYILYFAGGIALYLLLGFALWWVLDWYIAPNEAEVPSTAKKDLFQALSFIMAGVAGVVGVYFTWRNLRQTQEQTQENLRLIERGQITERFTQAIEQLGATDDKGKAKIEIRLGGIYALEKIADDSPERYDNTVMEVLSAYVRENAPWPPDEPSTTTSSKVPTDIQSILTILGQPNKEYSNALVLRATNLLGANLQDTEFSLASFSDANLSEADLRNVKLRRCDLMGCHCRKAVFWGADLQEAVLVNADLQETEFQSFVVEIPQQAFEYRYEAANLQGSHLGEANLQKADLREVNLRQAILWEANLQYTDLRDADLQDASLSLADLRGADLRGTKYLTQAQIEEAVGDATTKLPERLTQPIPWANSNEVTTEGE